MRQNTHGRLSDSYLTRSENSMCPERSVCPKDLCALRELRAWRGEWRGGRTVRLRTNECRKCGSICSQNATKCKTTNFQFPHKITTKLPELHECFPRLEAHTTPEKKPLFSRLHTKLRPKSRSWTSVSLVCKSRSDFN